MATITHTPSTWPPKLLPETQLALRTFRPRTPPSLVSTRNDRANTSERGGILIRGGADGLNYQCSRSPPSPRKCVEMGHPACVSFENTTSTMNIRMRTDCEQNNICAHHLCRAMPPWYTIAHIRSWLNSQAHNCFPNPQSTWSTMWRSILSTMHHLSRFETSATLE